ncbi:hypothetical protein [Mycobacterium lepromatosis]|uniref:hypothetical protein n=1 Tax=Mycobacterium lepromatosis TaxID=480418 RepID=UPI0006787C29|nr:hypothetical protein [Mycobacterium lepromatosis]
MKYVLDICVKLTVALLGGRTGMDDFGGQLSIDRRCRQDHLAGTVVVASRGGNRIVTLIAPTLI